MSQINLEYTSTRQYSVSYFGDGSEPTLSLCVKRGRFLLLLCSEHQISLRAKHNPRPGIVLVDYLSEGLGGERLSLGVVISPLSSSPVHTAVGSTEGGLAIRQAKPQARLLYVSLVLNVYALAQDAFAIMGKTRRFYPCYL